MGAFFRPNMTQENFIESGFGIKENTDGLLIQTYQEIPTEFVDGLKAERFHNSQARFKGEYHRAASIPQAIVDKWIRDGFDFWNASVPTCIAKLKAEGLDYFITSDKV
jgi:hypothetical protein